MTLLAVLSTAKDLVAFMLWQVTRGRKYAVPPIVLQDNDASFVLENLEDTMSRTNILSYLLTIGPIGRVHASGR